MKKMLQSIAVKKEKPRVFQVLLLDNGDSQDIHVQEAEQIDFVSVERHLMEGGSVFITSKKSQKLLFRNTKAHRNKK